MVQIFCLLLTLLLGKCIEIQCEALQAGIYMFNVNNRNARKISEICLKLTIKTVKTTLLYLRAWETAGLKKTIKINLKQSLWMYQRYSYDFQDRNNWGWSLLMLRYLATSLSRAFQVYSNMCLN